MAITGFKLEGKSLGYFLTVLSIIVILATAFISYGALAQRVDTLADKDSPSREEFDTLCRTSEYMNRKLDGLLMKNGLDPSYYEKQVK